MVSFIAIGCCLVEKRGKETVNLIPLRSKTSSQVVLIFYKATGKECSYEIDEIVWTKGSEKTLVYEDLEVEVVLGVREWFR